MATHINYQASPTAAKFHASKAFVRGLMGPIGSGKSVACVQDLLYWALHQQPDDQGIRKTRFAIIRNTYPELKSTTLKTWKDWIPVQVCQIVYDKPIRGKMEYQLPDGTTALMEVLFLALDQEKDVKKLLSLELTMAWLNEVREIPKAIIDAATGRVGRYPPKRQGGPTRYGVIMDTNPCDDDHWYYRLAEEEKPGNWNFFRQPPALLLNDENDWIPNPDAENVKHLTAGYGYWLNQVSGKSRQWIRVYIEGTYGTIMDGRAVYPEYRDDVHVAEEGIEPYEQCPLILGWDFGLTPACIIAQVSPRGRLVILNELVAERMGLRQFAEVVVKPFLASRLPNYPIGASSADPAGTAESQTDEQSCLQVLNEIGIQTYPAPTNKIEPRLQAVRDFLTRMIDGKPGFLMSKSCKVLRKGFCGGYKYQRVRVAGDERYKDKPDKNRYSHPHDALQYLCLAAGRAYDDLAVIQSQSGDSYGHWSSGDDASGYRPASNAGY